MKGERQDPLSRHLGYKPGSGPSFTTLCAICGTQVGQNVYANGRYFRVEPWMKTQAMKHLLGG